MDTSPEVYGRLVGDDDRKSTWNYADYQPITIGVTDYYRS